MLSIRRLKGLSQLETGLYSLRLYKDGFAILHFLMPEDFLRMNPGEVDLTNFLEMEKVLQQELRCDLFLCACHSGRIGRGGSHWESTGPISKQMRPDLKKRVEGCPRSSRRLLPQLRQAL